MTMGAAGVNYSHGLTHTAGSGTNSRHLVAAHKSCNGYVSNAVASDTGTKRVPELVA